MEIGFYLGGFSGYTCGATVTVNTYAGVTATWTNPYP
jgi:hypothetical protein